MLFAGGCFSKFCEQRFGSEAYTLVHTATSRIALDDTNITEYSQYYLKIDLLIVGTPWTTGFNLCYRQIPIEDASQIRKAGGGVGEYCCEAMGCIR